MTLDILDIQQLQNPETHLDQFNNSKDGQR